MKAIGALLVLFGAASFLLVLMERRLGAFSWIDNWGTTIGMVIRIGLIVIGAVLWIMGNKKESATPGN